MHGDTVVHQLRMVRNQLIWVTWVTFSPGHVEKKVT